MASHLLQWLLCHKLLKPGKGNLCASLAGLTASKTHDVILLPGFILFEKKRRDTE
jgi:hypothetical protein